VSLFLILFGRVILSVSASTLQKWLTSLHASGRRIWRVTYLCMVPPAIAAIVFSWRNDPGASFWRDAALAGLIDALGNLAALTALRQTDLSVFGPLNGFRPLLALLFGWIFLGEHVSAAGAFGVGVTVLGGALLLREENSAGFQWKPETGWRLFWRLFGISLSTFAAVFLKRAAHAGPTGMALGIWVISGAPIFWLTRPAPSPLEAAPWNKLLIIHGFVFFGMQWLTLEIFKATLLAYSFAFFQLGMVLQVFAGALVFKERHLKKRLVCCAIIAGGALLIALR
jgi:uncharacterized membrane protein